MHKLLVISIAKKAAISQTYEDVLVAELNQKGIDAVTGYKIKGDKADRQSIENMIKSAGADAVITIQTTGVEKRSYVQPGYMTDFGGLYDFPYRYPYRYQYGYYGYGGGATMYEPPYVSSQNVASIMVSLFDGKSGNLLWAASIQTEEPEQVVSVSKDLARIVIEGLMKKGFI
ncbi:MAG TPA: DUF4136 domain-containing protein [Negativicutes bacterium]